MIFRNLMQIFPTIKKLSNVNVNIFAVLIMVGFFSARMNISIFFLNLGVKSIQLDEYTANESFTFLKMISLPK